MKQQIFSISDPKFRDRIINLLQSTNGGHQNRSSGGTNGYNSNSTPSSPPSSSNNNNNEKSFDYQSLSTNFQHQIYGSTSAATLQQLKKILIEQAKDLKKCKNDLTEKDTEITRLKEENETLKTRVDRLEKKASAQNLTTTQEFVEIPFVTSSPIKPKTSSKKTRKRRISTPPDVQQQQQETAKKRAEPNEIRPKKNKRTENKNSVAIDDDSITTPGWRITNYSSTVVLEGTENITDDAFVKRHQKCEIEEKRIIRRDRMREREMELRRKLECQQKIAAAKPSEPIVGEPETPLDIESIAIVKRLPSLTSKSKSKSKSGSAVSKTVKRRRHR